MPRGKAAKPTANGAEKVSKMEAMRRAVQSLGKEASPKDLQGHIEKEYKLTMSYDMASTYKSSVLKELGKAKKPGGKPSKRPASSSGGQKPVARATVGGISLEDIRAVKDLADRIGAEKVQQLAQVLAK
jgi:hypothetical protein